MKVGEELNFKYQNYVLLNIDYWIYFFRKIIQLNIFDKDIFSNCYTHNNMQSASFIFSSKVPEIDYKAGIDARAFIHRCFPRSPDLRQEYLSKFLYKNHTNHCYPLYRDWNEHNQVRYRL